MDRKKVVTTWLELKKSDPVSYKKDYSGLMEVREIENDAYLNFILFTGVGLPWRWYSRLKWSRREWEEYFSGRSVKTFLGLSGKSVAGYYELEFLNNNEAEIKFIGLLPRYQGRGLGGALLSHAIKSSFDHGAGRVWLHTCSNDSESALHNYLARGFRIFREEEKFEEVPGKDELLVLVTRFFDEYYDHWSEKF